MGDITLTNRTQARSFGSTSPQLRLPPYSCNAEQDHVGHLRADNINGHDRMADPSPARQGVVIETGRLLLRPAQFVDLDRWAEMMADVDACRYVGGTQSKPIVWRSLMSQAGAWSLTGVAILSVLEKSTGRWVGRVGPWQPFGWPGTEIGWSLHPDAWGKGYAIEAARAAMEYAFTTLGWTDVIHCIHPENVRSQKLAQRLGSVNHGVGRLPAPYENSPVEIWGQTRQEWSASTAGT